MIKLCIKEWSEESAWVSDDHWSHSDYCQRIYPCTYLRGIALSSAAEALINRKRFELELVNREYSEALIFALLSSGARLEIKYLRGEKVISLAQFRRDAGVRAISHPLPARISLPS